MLETGNPKVDRILKKLTEAEVKTLTKHLTIKILNILVKMEKPGNNDNPLSI